MDLIDGDSRRLIERHLEGLLRRVLAADGAVDLTPLTEAISRFVLAGGKRVRPQLCLWTYVRSQQSGVRSHVAGSPLTPDSCTLTPALLDLACAWELFHAFLLCHDDIIDGADRRRDQPSLHRQLAQLDGGCPTFGRNLAIVAGDLLSVASVRLLHELDLPAETHRDVLRLFSRIACTTGYGQAVDICCSHAPIDAVGEQTLLREYRWKTAAYTFEGPMVSGAIVAGASPEARAAVSAFALALGEAYQLHNDLLDLAEPAHAGCDLVQGKRTVSLLRARAEMGDAERRGFDARLAALATANGHAVEMAEEIRRELHARGAVRHTADLIDELLDRAAAAAAAPALPAPLGIGMRKMLAGLRATYFATPADQRLIPAALVSPDALASFAGGQV